MGESFGQQMFKGFTSRGSLRANYMADLVATGTIKRVYTSASNSACAIVTEGVGGVPYVKWLNYQIYFSN